MGEYADMALEQSISEVQTWGWRRHRSTLDSPKTCNRCGYPALYWAQRDGKWRLHHWSCPTPTAKPQFVLHRCGLTSEGKPSDKYPAPDPKGRAQ